MHHDAGIAARDLDVGRARKAHDVALAGLELLQADRRDRA